jgi:hypothetical protein
MKTGTHGGIPEMEPYVKTVIAGVLFGMWPLLMSRSGLTAMPSAAVFAVAQACILLPLGVYAGISFSQANWVAATLAAVIGSMGLLTFTDVVLKTPKAEIGRLFIIMLVVQTAVPTIYHIAVSGGLTLKHALGILAALCAIILLV